MMERKEKIDEIRKYYMNPKSYPDKYKQEIETAISSMDDYLKNRKKDKDSEELISELCNVYSSNESITPINSLMRQSRADDDGVSATRGYREIYFNEIVQNANDNTNDNYLNIYANIVNDVYDLEFEYADPGFSVENIIGLFNSEIHTKKSNLAVTGKHGVGIKALFYFVDMLTIKSNIIATFNIKTINEDGVEKIESAVSGLEVNTDWDQKTTHLKIEYRKKDDYDDDKFNVPKLNKLIDVLCNTEILSYDEIKKFFYAEDQKELVFDSRSLLFTDKNKGKEKGITTISFFHNKNKRFSISVSKKNEFKGTKIDKDCYNIEQSSIRFNEEDELHYLVVTMESDGDQNFSIAFPDPHIITKGDARFYETYYIPKGKITSPDYRICVPFSILINSKYSSIDRQKLTDDEEKEPEIAGYINGKIVSILKQLTSDQLQKDIAEEIKLEISRIFHKCLLSDEEFISSCYREKIDNRYLLKFKRKTDNNEFMVYQRDDKKEPYEKKIIGQSVEVDEYKRFFEDNIIKKEAVKYDENLFSDDIIKNAYDNAFDTDNSAFSDLIRKELLAVLNAIGELKELIKYRITGSQYEEDISEQQIDHWVLTFQSEQQIMALSLIGRYKIHPGVSGNGEILSSSFYEYLFSDDHSLNAASAQKQREEFSDDHSSVVTFAQKQQEEFSEKYASLKERLLGLLVNREKSGEAEIYGKGGSHGSCRYGKGEVAFFASWDDRASCEVFYDPDSWVEYDYYDVPSNTRSFGNELFDLLLERFSIDPDICKHIKKFGDKMMLTGSTFPQWGRPQAGYDRSRDIWHTGEWFTAKVINLGFMTNIAADNMSRLNEYVDYFDKNKENWGDFKFDLSANIDYSDHTLIELMDLFYGYGLINPENTVFSSIKIEIKNVKNELNEQNDNLCSPDYADFIREMTGLNIILAQRGNIRSKGKELIFLYKKSVKIYNGSGWKEISTAAGNDHNENVIVFIGELDWKEALPLVLREICKEDDAVKKCEAFIPQNQGIAVWGEHFTGIQDSEYAGAQRSRNVFLSECASAMSVEQLKYIITARGNNNNSCGCCGTPLKSQESQKLIIVANGSPETNKDYPHIINVVCDDCYSLLKKSHKESEVSSDENGLFVKHTCLLQNSHQEKEVIKKYYVCKGIESIWKRAVEKAAREYFSG